MKPPSDPAGTGGAGGRDQAGSVSGAGPNRSTPGAAGSLGPHESSIVVATFPSGRTAERAVARLGFGFRRQSRRGHADAYVVTGNQQGSFSLVRSRFVSASGLVAAFIGMAVSIMAGFHGIRSALTGAKTGAGAVRTHEGHVGGGAERVRELLDQAGERRAGVVIRCPDDEARQKVDGRAAQHATGHWRGSRSEFLAALERRGSQYDWLRPAAGKPAHAGR